MKILHISAASEQTGAGKATLLTHKALKELGVDSQVLFLKSKTKDTNIYSYHDKNVLTRFWRFFITSLDRFPLLFYRNKKNQIFSPGFVGLKLSNYKLVKWADIIHIHWANHGFIDIKEINNWGKPVVWTLRDMWAFTGGCHHSFSCNKYHDTCGLCPVLRSSKIKDLSFLSQKRKLKYLSNENIKWVAISRWMQKAAQNSAILFGKEIDVIHSGVNGDKYTILNKSELRKKYAFNLSDKIILIGAGNIRESYKGFKYVVKVLNKSDKDLVVITFGSTSFIENEIPQKFFHYGVIGESQLSELYNLSDLFFGPSVAEAMGKTFLEAQLCGLPVLCFKDTGPEDIIKHEDTGYLAKFKNEDDLLNGFNYCISKKWNRDLIRNNAKENFDIKNIATKYIEIYEKSIVDWSCNKS